jgi:NADH-quinone oxidoreductase subunit G
MAARSWEMIQHATVAPHDSIGSNLYMHTLRGRVMRTVPRENESINETWLSDRDRFGYQGLYSDDRLETPMVKRNGEWLAVDWETALASVVDGLKRFPPAEVGALTAANATLEEMYLLQKLLRGIGVHNIDHRLRQIDFRDQDQAPSFPWLGQSIEELEYLDAALLVGTNIRKEQPIASHRLRKAALKGAAISVVNPCDFDFIFPVAEQVIGTPQGMLDALTEIATAALAQVSAEPPQGLVELLEGVQPSDQAKSVAEHLSRAEHASVFLGAIAIGHPEFSLLRALASVIAEQTGARFGYFAEAANTAGAWLAGAVPHRLPGGLSDETPGMCAREQIETPRKSYILFGVEPEFDCEDPAGAQTAVSSAEFVVVCASFASESTKRYADVMLPIATFAETSGTFVNAEGRWQSFKGVGSLPGESRPAWRVLRVLGNLFALDGFDYMSTEQVREEIKSCIDTDKPFDNRVSIVERLRKPTAPKGLVRASSPSIYAIDSLVRRATALQGTEDGRAAAVYMNEQQAKQLRLGDVLEVVVRQGTARSQLPLMINNGVPMGCVWIPTGVQGSTKLASSFGPISLEKADAA